MLLDVIRESTEAVVDFDLAAGPDVDKSRGRFWSNPSAQLECMIMNIAWRSRHILLPNVRDDLPRKAGARGAGKEGAE